MKKKINIGEHFLELLKREGYNEIIQTKDCLTFAKMNIKPIIPNTGNAQYQFDQWKLFEVEITLPEFTNSFGKKFGGKRKQWWLENAYLGVQFKDKTSEIVCNQLLNYLAPKPASQG